MIYGNEKILTFLLNCSKEFSHSSYFSQVNTLLIPYPYYFFLLLLFCLSCAEPSKAPSTSNQEYPAYSQVPSQLGLIHQMQGRWTDSRIKNAELLITGNKFIAIYKKEIRNRATFEVFKNCPPFCQGKQVPTALAYFIVHREDGDYCYALDKLANGILEYTPL